MLNYKKLIMKNGTIMTSHLGWRLLWLIIVTSASTVGVWYVYKLTSHHRNNIEYQNRLIGSDINNIQLDVTYSQSSDKFGLGIVDPGINYTSNKNGTCALSHLAADKHSTLVLRTAKQIYCKYGTVLVTVINDAFLPFVYSWLCNTQSMNIHRQVLIIASDVTSERKLKTDWPEVSVVSIPTGAVLGNQNYTRVGYVRLQVRRAEILHSLLEEGIKLLLFEVDCLWILNPLPQLESMSDDLVVTPVSQRPGEVAAGFLYMVPNTRMRKLWNALVEKLQKLASKIAKRPDDFVISEGDNDNNYLTNLVTKRYGGIRAKFLSAEKYPDGKWYTLSEAARSKTKPVLINNNWIIGVDAKIDRAKKWGHWFLNDGWTCNAKQVVTALKTFA